MTSGAIGGASDTRRRRSEASPSSEQRETAARHAPSFAAIFLKGSLLEWTGTAIACAVLYALAKLVS